MAPFQLGSIHLRYVFFFHLKKLGCYGCIWLTEVRVLVSYLHNIAYKLGIDSEGSVVLQIFITSKQ